MGYKQFSVWTSLIGVSVSVLCLVDNNFSNNPIWHSAKLYSYPFLRQFPSQWNVPCLTVLFIFFLLQTSKSEFWGKMYLNLHGTASFYHWCVQVPCFLFYPLNSHLEISLQCDSSAVALEEQRDSIQLWQKCRHIHLLVWSAERWDSVWHWHCIWRVLFEEAGQTL